MFSFSLEPLFLDESGLSNEDTIEASTIPMEFAQLVDNDPHRWLQTRGRQNQGNVVLTVLYMCILALCFVVPVFYYLRMHCEERHARRIRELEIAGITEALEQSQNVHREENRAARRKYREERRARILQLFAPVRMVLKEEDFPHLREAPEDTETRTTVPEMEACTTADVAADSDSDGDADGDPDGTVADGGTDDLEQGVEPVSAPMEPIPTSTSAPEASMKSCDMDNLTIEIPTPGLQYQSPSLIMTHQTLRQVPNLCSICLCNYEVGDEIIWSTNEACEHVFHEQCILQWLMKQRDGPLCPCCRRDFVVDPFDMGDEDVDPALFPSLDENGETSADLSLDVTDGPPAIQPSATGSTQSTEIATMEEGLSPVESPVDEQTAVIDHSSPPWSAQAIIPSSGSETATPPERVVI